MQLGMVGLGRMGANLVRRLMMAGHQCVVYDIDVAAVEELAAEGAVGAKNLDDFVKLLEAPRAAWVMVPAAFAGATVASLAERMSAGDIVIDGGNSFYRDDISRAEDLATLDMHYVDVGTSGGVFGLERGYCLMIGGEPEVVAHLNPIFETLAPGPGEIERTSGRTGEPTPAERGYLHCGPHGAGHFVKMVHNGIEYGLMAAYAEGLAVLDGADAGVVGRKRDAETAPLPHPEHYLYDFDITEVVELWRRGSVVSSWLLDLTAAVLVADPDARSFGGRVADSGEGRWTVQAAVDEGIPVPVLSAALFARFSSRGNADYADRVLSAMRKEFGGHTEATHSEREG